MMREEHIIFYLNSRESLILKWFPLLRFKTVDQICFLFLVRFEGGVRRGLHCVLPGQRSSACKITSEVQHIYPDALL